MFANILKKTMMIWGLFSVLMVPLTSFCHTNHQDNSERGVGFFALGAGILGGFGLSQLFCSKSDSQIIEGISISLDDANGYNKQIEILDNVFDLHNLLKNKKVVVNVLDEEINYDLATNGIPIDYHYINDLSTLISDLQFYQNKLPKRIKKLNYKLKRKRDCEFFLKQISQMESLLKSVDKILPNLEFLKNYIKARYNYFEFYNIIMVNNDIYNKEISSLEKYTEDKLAKELTRSARTKFSESSLYPCIEYVNSIERNIYKINNYIKKLPDTYQDLHEDALDLVNYLKKIKQSIIGDTQYIQEKRDLYGHDNPRTFFGLTYNVC